MAGTWLTADEIILLVDKQIALLGLDAFGPNKGKAQLYSGPSDEVRKSITGSVKRNQERGFIQALTNDAVLLDTTPIGRFLATFEGMGVYDYFRVHPFVPASKAQVEADKVTRYASRKFIESLWGKVTTAVCGAAKERVFYQDEIPAFAETVPDLIAKLLKAKDIDTINGVSASKIRKVYKPGDYDAAFRLICLSEIRSARLRARVSGKAEDFTDYLERREFYIVEREMAWRGTSKAKRPIYNQTPSARLAWKEERLNHFVTEQLRRASAAMMGIATIPTLPARIVLPVSAHGLRLH